jgi:hypothetical protein
MILHNNIGSKGLLNDGSADPVIRTTISLSKPENLFQAIGR